MNATQRLTALREKLKEHGIAAFILPVGDEFLSEYVPARAMRLAWLTGFSGSAGMAAVTQGKAALFVDGRYTLQATDQVDASLYEIHNISDVTLTDWLKQHTVPVSGFDPMLHSMGEVERLQTNGLVLNPLAVNPIDALWDDRPSTPAKEGFAYPLNYAGESAADKRTRMALALVKEGADGAILAATDSVNWLLNIRGHDVEFTPILQAYALLDADGAVTLYTDEQKISMEMRHALEDVTIQPLARIFDDLTALRGTRLLADPALTPFGLASAAEKAGATLVKKPDPCQLAKAIKNPVELKHMRNVHLRDGAALSTFLHWVSVNAPDGKVDELAVEKKLLECRKADQDFLYPSFATIAGSGAHGAIVHYRTGNDTNRTAQPGELLLVDSGGQYLGGTTDVTRTLAIGTAAEEVRRQFTLVLKGHIALAAATFPEGTSGSALDVLARQYLWAEGLDFDHGTGHGVGVCLNVHEGPQRISKRAFDQPLVPGMILSNEPGYYEAGSHGIRIENLVEVVEKTRHGGKRFFGFQTLTCAPIDRSLIIADMLTTPERHWLNTYHQWVLSSLKDKVAPDVTKWLVEVCGEV